MSEAPALSGTRVLVTGAGGFIGSRICTQAIAAGAQVRALIRGPAPARIKATVGLEIARGDLSKRSGLVPAIAGCQIVVNAAYDFEASRDELLQGFDNLREQSLAQGVRHFVQLSSIAVYDDWPGGDLTEESPMVAAGSLYKRIKAEMEWRLEAGDLPYTILQPTIVYGPRGWQWTELLLDQLRTGVVLLPDGPEGLCHAVHVDDVARAAICAMTVPPRNRRYIVSGPRPVGWRTVYGAYASIIGAAAPRIVPLEDEASAPDTPDAGRVIRTLRRTLLISIGRERLRKIRSLLLKVRFKSTPAVHRPSGPMLALLKARGSCSTERAAAELGFTPVIGFADGIADIRSAYGL